MTKNLILMGICMVSLFFLSMCHKKLDKNDYECVKKFQNIPEQIEIFNCGNSHGLYGFCYDDIRDKSCFNFGLVSQSLDYDYRLLRQYQDNLAEGGIMFISISYFSLFGKDEIERENFESLNRRYYRILSPRYIKGFSVKEELLVNTFSIMGTADNIIYDIMTGEERGRISRDLWEQNLLESSREAIDADAESACERHMAERIDGTGNWILNQNNMEALYDIIELCREKNITPVLVTTPYLHEYIEAIKSEFPDFFSVFYGLVEEIKKETGVVYHDYSGDIRFKDKYGLFFSVDHLNRQGALLFTSIVLEDCMPELILSK